MNNNLTKRSDDACPPTSTFNVFAGIWLIVSPWVLGFAGRGVPLWDALLVGVAVAVLALIRLRTPGATGLSWINLFLGIWLILSPFVLGFTTASAAMSNAIFLGILVSMFSALALATQSPAPSPR
jgi:hypothetical protein